MGESLRGEGQSGRWQRLAGSPLTWAHAHTAAGHHPISPADRTLSAAAQTARLESRKTPPEGMAGRVTVTNLEGGEGARRRGETDPGIKEEPPADSHNPTPCS